MEGSHCQVLLSFLLISFRKGSIGDLSSSTAKAPRVCFMTVGSGVEAWLGDFFLCLLPFCPCQQPEGFPVDTEAVAGLTPTLTEAGLDSKWAPGDSCSVSAFGTQPGFHCQTLSPVSCFYC